MKIIFSGEFGFIRYSVQGIIERPWKNNITTRRVITVWEYLDCNNPLLSAPQVRPVETARETERPIERLIEKEEIEIDRERERVCVCVYAIEGEGENERG